MLNPRMKLPELNCELVRLEFDCQKQQDVYKAVEKEFKTCIEETENGTKLYTEALERILRCRQVCCHPLVWSSAISKIKMPRESGWFWMMKALKALKAG